MPSLGEILTGEDARPPLTPALSLGASIGQPEGVRWRDYTDRQVEFMQSKAKRRVVRAGRRGGKTTGFGGIAAQAFLEGRRVLYGGPTADQLDQFWGEVTWILEEPLSRGIWYRNNGRRIIERRGTRNRIRAKTVWIPDDLRGDSADLLLLDEFQMMAEDVWELVGQPMLIDNDGDAVFGFTVPSLLSRSHSKAKDKMHASKLYKKHENDPPGSDWQCFTFSSHENRHVSKEAIERMREDMTAMAYRQEILAEDPDEVPGALWTRDLIDKGRIRVGDEPDPMVRMAIGVDPPGGATECGIITVGIAPQTDPETGKTEMHAYVLSDASLAASPRTWAKKIIAQYNGWDADRVIAEINFGGDMVESTIRTQSQTVPITTVHASRGKAVRAEPVAALYEGDNPKIHHVGTFKALEEEMTTWIPGEPNQASPNRMDALVWAIWYLLLRKKRKVVWGHSKASDGSSGKEAIKK